MSGEQSDEPTCSHGKPMHQDCYVCEPSARVTDEVGDVIDQCVLKLANTQMNMSLEEWGEISNALLGVGIAHRATEAKLRKRENQLADALAKAGRFEGQLATLNTAYETSVRGQAAAEAKLTAALAELDAAYRHITLVESALATANAKNEKLEMVAETARQIEKSAAGYGDRTRCLAPTKLMVDLRMELIELAALQEDAPHG